MAYQKITINNFEEYITELRDFAVLNDWILEEYVTNLKVFGQNGYNTRLVLKNIDNSVYVGYQIYYDYDSTITTTSGYKNLNDCYINVNVFSSYDNTKTFQNQENAYTSNVYFSFRDETLASLYIQLNTNRIVTSVHSSSYLSNCFVGKYLGFGSELEQPFQYFISCQNTQSSLLSSIVNVNSFRNIKMNFLGDYNSVSYIYPNDISMNTIMRNDDFTYTLYPIQFFTNDNYAIGELDSIYLISSDRAAIGFEFTLNSVDYIVLSYYDNNNTLYCIPKN